MEGDDSMATDEAAAAEDAFLKRLKGLTAYTDMFSSAAATLDTGHGDPASQSRMLGSLVPAIAKEGLEGFMRNNAQAAAELVKARGAAAHPAVKLCADESAKISDDDFKALVKPLRLLVQTIAKAKLPYPQAPRGWVGDKPKFS
jgi:hypothetical protein